MSFTIDVNEPELDDELEEDISSRFRMLDLD